MKKHAIVYVLFSLLVWPGCKSKHPGELTVNPDFKPNEVGSILVLPFESSIIEGLDPDRQSETIMTRVLWDALSNRSDHNLLSPEQFRFALRREDVGQAYEGFKKRWMTQHEADVEFLGKLRQVLSVDMVLIPHVYLWHKDEADYREEGTASSTQVGATLTLVDASTGAIMWEATDENVKESVRTEGERVTVSSGGIHRRVSGVTATGRDQYAAPPYEDVAVMVLEVLVDAMPKRGAQRQ